MGNLTPMTDVEIDLWARTISPNGGIIHKLLVTIRRLQKELLELQQENDELENKLSDERQESNYYKLKSNPKHFMEE